MATKKKRIAITLSDEALDLLENYCELTEISKSDFINGVLLEARPTLLEFMKMVSKVKDGVGALKIDIKGDEN